MPKKLGAGGLPLPGGAPAIAVEAPREPAERERVMPAVCGSCGTFATVALCEPRLEMVCMTMHGTRTRPPPSLAGGPRGAQAVPAAPARALGEGPEREPARARRPAQPVLHHAASPGARGCRPGEGLAGWKARGVPARAPGRGGRGG